MLFCRALAAARVREDMTGFAAIAIDLPAHVAPPADDTTVVGATLGSTMLQAVLGDVHASAPVTVF